MTLYSVLEHLHSCSGAWAGRIVDWLHTCSFACERVHLPNSVLLNLMLGTCFAFEQETSKVGFIAIMCCMHGIQN